MDTGDPARACALRNRRFWVCRYDVRLVGGLAFGVLLLAMSHATARAAQQLVDSQVSFATQDQSMWSSGDAFIFNYSQFFGIDSNPNPVTVNPSAASGTGYTVDPYFLFDTDFRTGMEVGASVNGGSIDANLDYQITLEAPDTLLVGQAFSLTGSASPLGTSGFESSPANASAYVDGILDVYFGGYARFTTSGFALGTHDYRMGNTGFTDDPASDSNHPYRTLANVNYSPEIIGINRNESGQLHVLGQNQGGAGSEYTLGSTTITAGNWNVAATGQLQGDVVQGADEVTLVTATLDIDQMATLGVPALGTGFAHDWGVIDIDVGYDVVDVRSSLAMGLRQDFSLSSDVTVHLQFSEDVQLAGVGLTDSYVGPLSSIPEITLLSDTVTVTPEFIVQAQLNNDTDITFNGSVGVTIIEGHVYAAWDAGIFGSGTAADFSIGPFYDSTSSIPLFDIDVFSSQFALGGFDIIPGTSFILMAEYVPGDGNGDGHVDGGDYLLWAAHFGDDPADDPPGAPENGDYNNDGKVSGLDYLLWAGNFGQGPNDGVAVPEPGALVMVLLAFAASLAVPQRRRG